MKSYLIEIAGVIVGVPVLIVLIAGDMIISLLRSHPAA
jgi:hypothetical protein